LRGFAQTRFFIVGGNIERIAAGQTLLLRFGFGRIFS
jgi:hypothetical protein